MQKSLAETLPGLAMFDAFFASLPGGDFEPVVLSESEKAVVVNTICALKGEPKECLMPFSGDFGLSAQVREARRYTDGTLYVRCEFRRITLHCDWSEPHQFMAIFGRDGSLQRYTVLNSLPIHHKHQAPGTRRNAASPHQAPGTGLYFGLADGWFDWSHYTETQDVAEALAHLRKPGRHQIGVRESGVKCDFRVYSQDGLCTVEWFLCCEPWMFAEPGLSIDDVEKMIAEIARGGLTALAAMREWHQLDYQEDYNEYGFYVNIDRALTRSLELAKRRGDERRIAELHRLGISGDRIEDSYFIRISAGSHAEERRTFQYIAKHETDKSKAAKLLAIDV